MLYIGVRHKVPLCKSNRQKLDNPNKSTPTYLVGCPHYQSDYALKQRSKSHIYIYIYSFIPIALSVHSDVESNIITFNNPFFFAVHYSTSQNVAMYGIKQSGRIWIRRDLLQQTRLRNVCCKQMVLLTVALSAECRYYS